MRAFAAVLVLGCLLRVGTPASADDRQQIDDLSSTEISALQRRLADAGCYTGPLDGRPTRSTKVAVKACPDQRPQLRIETGMHVARIFRIGVDRDCRIAATGSDDKTLRLWSLPDGKLLRVLRWPIGEGLAGAMYAAAVSPDGRYAVAGGMDAAGFAGRGMGITVFDTATGAVVARVDGFKIGVARLAFSFDGRWLAATMGAGGGVRMIDTSTWRVVAEDRAYSGDADGAVFAPDGHLFTAGYDGGIRRYSPGPAFRREAAVRTQGGRLPYTISVDKDGQALAVGFYEHPIIDFYDPHSLRLLGNADTRGFDNGNFAALAWRRDGQELVAAGRYAVHETAPILAYDRGGHRVGDPVPLSTESILDIQPCGDGYAVATGGPEVGLLDANRQKLLWKETAAIDMRNKRDRGFTLSPDARRVRFGLGRGEADPVLFDLTVATLSESVERPADLSEPKIEGLPIEDWLLKFRPLYKGLPLRMQPNDVSRALAIRPDGKGLALATAFTIRALDAAGSELWSVPALAEAWGVNVSGDGRIVVVAYSDGTLRWLRWSDGHELLTLFVNKLNRTWVAWTPSGYYMASPGGEDMIGWHVNRGWAQPADFFPASKFRDQFSRPDVVERVLDTLDEAEAVRQAGAARGGKVAPARPLLERLPPVITILSPGESASAGEEVKVDYLVRSPSNLPVDAVEALVDGRPPSGNRGLARISEGDALKQCLAQTGGLGRSEGALQGCRGSLTVALPAGASEIGLFARSGDKTSDVVRVRLAQASASRGVDLPKPRLFAMIVGISAYANPDYALTYPAKDAQDFATSLQNQKGGQYGDVVIRTLTDGQATAGAIKDGLDWLTKQVTNRDVGLVYLAGHGMLDERDRFYFLAADSDAARLRATAVPRDDIADTLDALPGKALLFLDACHAGAVALGRKEALNVNAVVNDLADAEHGVTVFAASTGRQLSQENQVWNNGAFTKAVVEGLGLPGTRAKADFIGSGTITTSELDAYVTNRVKGLTSGGQSPVMIRPATVLDFPLASAR